MDATQPLRDEDFLRPAYREASIEVGHRGSNLARKVQRVRDPVHNLIQFNDNDLDQMCWRALGTRPLQRLRRIKQLGFSDYVYPGASHSRLAHSIGVFHTARQLSEVISDRLGGPQNGFDSNRSRVAVAAALVHDIGHGPFSHAFEHALDTVRLSRRHETRTDRLIKNTELSDVFKEGFGSDFGDKVSQIITSKDPADIYASIVSSQFDADRLDYMRRDRLMAGTQQSAIDFEWLLRNLEVRRVDIGVDEERVKQVDTFVLNPKAAIAAEGYALSLFYLYINVYFHKTTRGFEGLFSALMSRVAELTLADDVESLGLGANHPIIAYLKNPDSIEAFLRLDDSVVYGALSLVADAKDSAVAELATRIRDRKAYRCVDVSKFMAAKFEQPDSPDKDVRAVARKEAQVRAARAAELVKERKLTSLRQDNVPLVLEDENAIRAAYKQEGKLSSILLIGPDGNLHDLANFSPVIDAIEPYRAYRLYARNEEASKAVDAILKDACQ
jgi:HD superfamily phosphohydrolase